MNHKQSDPHGDGPSILDQLENARDVLHAVDGDIEGFLSQSSPAQDAVEIPILKDVVGEPSRPVPHSGVQSAGESSADDQLSRTNKYKTLSDSDLERAAGVESQNEPPTDSENQRLPAAETAFDAEFDAFDLDLDLETELAMANIGNDVELPPVDHAILPDIDQLDADLGVAPLPPATEPTASQSEDEQPGPERAAGNDAPNFSISTSTPIELFDNNVFGQPGPGPLETPVSPAPVLTAGQLTQLIEQVLDSHMLSLQQALLERLEPYVSRES